MYPSSHHDDLNYLGVNIFFSHPTWHRNRRDSLIGFDQKSPFVTKNNYLTKQKKTLFWRNKKKHFFDETKKNTFLTKNTFWRKNTFLAKKHFFGKKTFLRKTSIVMLVFFVKLIVRQILMNKFDERYQKI